MDEQLDTLEHAQQTAIDLAIQFGPRLLVALLILAAGYYVRPWTAVADFPITSADITRAVLETFRESGIHIPFPQREVRLLGTA